MKTNTTNKPANIEYTNITTEMRECYIDYAMSVIVGRALPDVRDGMKPVHRRILYAMHELGLSPERPFRKCVRIVGDVLGKFHPHGDASVYDALTRMAQDFTTRYPTVKGHGNFGSIDGDSPAAMRYTEAKLDFISSEMLRDINKNTVNFIDNFDGSETEPEVLTSRFPHLLVNGSSGIAVGMATNMPPHNLGEVIDATIAYIKNPEINVDGLLKKLPGPDFPTGGIINGKDGIKEAYETGHGKLKVRGKAEIVPAKRGKNEIVITEIPYLVNKAKLIEKIAQLHHNKKIEGITEVRDESDLKNGIRVVVELKKGINPQIVLNQLFKYTDLENTFGIINLALVPDQENNLHPRILSLPAILKEYVAHQREVITRRTQFDLDKAEKRAHILEGLLLALDNIDEIISIIRSSRSTKSASSKLIKRFKLSEAQATAILDMRLQRLVGLERSKLKKEYKELQELIKHFKKILSDENEIAKVIIEELTEIKKKYSDNRRTEIRDKEKIIDEAEYIPEKELNVTLTKKGYLNSTESNRTKNINTGEDDIIQYNFTMSNFSNLLFITNKGKAYRLSGSEIPDVRSKGTNIKSIFNMNDDEQVINVFQIDDFTLKKDILMASKNGLVKKMNLKDFDSQLKSGISAFTLRTKDDELRSALILEPKDRDVILGTKNGMGIKIGVKDIKPTGRAASGVKGVTINEGDEMIGMIPNNKYVLTITDDGLIKAFASGDLKKQKRGGKGLKIVKDKSQKVFDILGTDNFEIDVLFETNKGFETYNNKMVGKRTDKGIPMTNGKIIDIIGTKEVKQNNDRS